MVFRKAALSLNKFAHLWNRLSLQTCTKCNSRGGSFIYRFLDIMVREKAQLLILQGLIHRRLLVLLIYGLPVQAVVLNKSGQRKTVIVIIAFIQLRF